MVVQVKVEGIKMVCIYVLFDGCDVLEISVLDYVVFFEVFLVELSIGGFDVCIVFGGGCQYIIMDCYDVNWLMVEKGWKIYVLG